MANHVPGQSPAASKPSPTLQQFLATLTRSQLLEEASIAAQLSAFRSDQPAEESTLAFARFLVRRGALTRYQAERLLAGRSEGFFLGGCKLLDKLGSGGMSQVYLAEQTRLARKVALKVLPRRLAADPDFVTRFHREARAAAALKHPNIVQIYDVGEERGVHFLVMEYLPGETVAKRLARQGVFSPGQSIEIIRQVAEGLAHAHAGGIVHRDIKPSNLILEQGTVKILDLGLARRSENGETVTKEVRVFGTPDYMSPEQCTDARTADARSDLYSLGCTWYALLCGRAPFDGTDIAKVMAHVHTPPPLEALPPSTPAAVRTLIGELLAKRPEDRPASAGALIRRLDQIKAAAETPTLIAGEMLTPAFPSGSIAEPGESNELSPQNSDEREPLLLQTSGTETLVDRPATGVPTFLLYLVPTMAALVLGGAYFGIEALRKQVQIGEPLVVELPAREAAASTASIPSTPETAKAQPLNHPAGEAGRNDHIADQLPANRVVFAPAGQEEAHPIPIAVAESPDVTSRPARKVRVETPEEFMAAWSEAVEGDHLELAPGAILRLGRLTLDGKSIDISAPDRAVIVLEAETGLAEGLWQLRRSAVSVFGVDFYVTPSSLSSEATAIDAIESDVTLAGCTVTVTDAPGNAALSVTLVRMLGERDWNPGAGETPSPLALDLRDLVMRGSICAAKIDSRHSRIRVANVLAASSLPLLQLRHSRPLEFAHHGVDIEITDATLDLTAPVATIETRPFDLHPVRTAFSLRRSFVADGGPASDPPPQIAWTSPVITPVVSEALRWVADGNLFLQRGPGLTIKTALGPIAVLVAASDDWQAQGLGIEADTVLLDKSPQLPRGAFDRRLPRDYPIPAQLGRLVARGRNTRQTNPVGADVRKLNPKSWMMIQTESNSTDRLSGTD